MKNMYRAVGGEVNPTEPFSNYNVSFLFPKSETRTENISF
jgi:hypothetical protein